MADDPKAQADKLLARRIAKQKRILDKQNVEADMLEQRLKLLEDADERVAAELAYRKKMADVMRLTIEYMEEQMLLAEKISDADKAAYKAAKDKLKTYEKQTDLYDRVDKRMQAIAESAKNLTGHLGWLVGGRGTKVGAIFRDLTAVMEHPLKAIKSLTQGFNLFNAAVNMSKTFVQGSLEATVLLAVEQDQVMSAFNRTSLAMGSYDQQLRDLEAANFDTGVNTEGLTKSLQALRNGLVDVKSGSAAVNNEMINMVAQLERLGVSADISAKNMLFFQRSMGMSKAAATNATISLLGIARALDMDPGKVSAQFANMQGSLRMFGKDAIRIFKDTAAAAKGMGIEMDRLFQIAEGYRSLEGAYTVAGRLNAILGGPMVSGMQLLQKSWENPVEAVRYLSSAMKAAGKEFDSLPPILTQVIAKVAGFQNADELARIMNEDKVAAKEARDNMEKFGMTTEEVTKINKDYLTLGEQLQMWFKTFAVRELVPVIDNLKSFLTVLIDINKAMHGYFFTGALLVVGLKILATWIWGIGTALKAATLALISNTASTAANDLAQKKLAATTQIAAVKAGAATKMMMGFGVAMIGVGIGVGAAAVGIGYMAKSFALLEPNQLAALNKTLLGMGIALGVLVIAMPLMGKFAAAAAGPMMAFGAGVALVGGGIALMGLGIKFAADGMAVLLGVFIQHVEILPTLAEGVALLAGAMAAFVGTLAIAGALAPLVGTGIAAMAVAVGTLAVALKFIKTEDLAAIGNVMSGIGNIAAAKNATANLKAAALMVSNVLDAIDDIDTEKGETAARVFRAVHATQQATSGNAAAQRVAWEQLAGGGGSSGPTHIKIENKLIIDGDMFYEKVVDMINERS